MAHEWMAERVRGYAPSVFAEMSALAQELNAVNLGQGFPDFDGPETIKEVAKVAIDATHNQYAVSSGEPELRAAIAEHAARFYQQQVDPASDITVTSGASEGIWCAAFAFIEPADEVIVFEPFFDTYVPNIRMAGGTPVAITLRAPAFRPDPDELRAAFGPRTKAIFVNTPHNPTGTVFSQEELSLIAELCQEHDVLAITDEVYEHIVYEGATHRRLATFPGMWDRTLTLSSGGKSFSFTGWKIGWAIGPAHLQDAIRRIHQFTVFASTTPMQYAIAAALRLPDEYFRDLAAEYQARRDFLMDVLEETGLEPTEPEGSYFILARIDNFPHDNALEFSRFLVREIGVAAIPPGTFYLHPEYGEKLVRFCFCKRWETLEAAAERLVRLRA
ncbi:MAG: methionine aminotransferase [Chloroflexota bacterium]|nr:methionine aminotransferase [Chloroflexota bacterium]